jgi:hypothetical protein
VGGGEKEREGKGNDRKGRKEEIFFPLGFPSSVFYDP